MMGLACRSEHVRAIKVGVSTFRQHFLPSADPALLPPGGNPYTRHIIPLHTYYQLFIVVTRLPQVKSFPSLPNTLHAKIPVHLLKISESFENGDKNTPNQERTFGN